MGEVSKFEFDCFGNFTELFKLIPEFNDRRGRPNTA